MKSKIGIWFYRLLEKLDGEQGFQVIAYSRAQRYKVYLMQDWIG